MSARGGAYELDGDLLHGDGREMDTAEAKTMDNDLYKTIQKADERDALAEAAKALAEALQQNHSGVLCDASVCVICAALAKYAALERSGG